MKTVVIVEDEPLMREELMQIMKKAGYDARAVFSFHEVAKQVMKATPDLVILDLNLPGESGFQICRDLKQKASAPVLVLTSRDNMEDELQALGLGADEYLTKPCRKERLLARAANLLKRFEGRVNLLEAAGVLLDRQTYTLYTGNRSVVLPGNQGKLLEAFMEGRDRILTKTDLCNVLWGTEEYIDENALQVNLTRLKKTMSALGMKQQITTVRGKGYRLEDRGE